MRSVRQPNEIETSTFYVIGLSYKKADAEVRGIFSLTTEKINQLTEKAKQEGISGLLAISTCNRTELYGFVKHPYELIKLLCNHTKGTIAQFQEVAYIYKNQDAINHLFRVGTGLDSQILGDFEIISQIKQGFYRSKKLNMTNPFLERLCNSVIQASKKIKTETELSSGATSVAYASVRYMMEQIPEMENKKILLFGTGKIGRNTCENLVKHSQGTNITLINRTKEKAIDFGKKLNLAVKSYGELQAEIRKCDVLVVATGAQRPTVSKSILFPKKPLWILDLSIPKNVDDNVSELEGVSLISLDQLSKMTDETLEKRKKFIPRAEEIIQEIQNDFVQWLETRKFAPVIKALKQKLSSIKEEELDYLSKKTEGKELEKETELVSDRIIQKITKQFANHLKNSNGNLEENLQLIQQVFQLEIKP